MLMIHQRRLGFNAKTVRSAQTQLNTQDFRMGSGVAGRRSRGPESGPPLALAAQWGSVRNVKIRREFFNRGGGVGGGARQPLITNSPGPPLNL